MGTVFIGVWPCIENSQENHQYYRSIIYNYINLNKDILFEYFPKLENENEIDHKNRYITFINSINILGTYAGDFEISASCLSLNKRIIIYRNSVKNFEFVNEYSNVNSNYHEKDIIMHLYKNNNHFNLLLNKKKDNIMNLETEINFENIHKRIEKNIHLLKKEQIENYKINSFLIQNYVDYPRKECKNLYNEMFIFLTKNSIPERIKSRYQKLYDNSILSTEKANNHLLKNPFIPKEIKQIEQRKKEKRNLFRKLSKKYRIKDNRLIYLYKYKGKVLEKKIPFSNEVNNILFDCHCTEAHNGFDKSKKILLRSEYYFEGITGILKKFIENCPICQIKYNSKHVNIPEKPILKEGPHIEYQIDLFYLPSDISTETGFNYIVSIIDQFAKWLWCFPIKEKTGEVCLLCFKQYIYAFGPPKKLHSDNGREFKNHLFFTYCMENNINHVFCKPYNPKSNGCIEASHKEIKKILFDNYYTRDNEIDKEFKLLDSLILAISIHNNKVHTTTDYKPSEIRDITDSTIINIVKQNIEKVISKAISKKKLNLLEEGDLLLIYNNITLKGNEIIKLKKKIKGDYNIPSKFVKYIKNNKLKILISKNYKNILSANELYTIEYILCREVTEEGYNYFL